MFFRNYFYLLFLSACLGFFTFSCKNVEKPPEVIVVATPEEIDESAADYIKQGLSFAGAHEGKLSDSIQLLDVSLLEEIYRTNDNAPVWSHEESWKPLADSIISLIDSSEFYGLFPEDYYAGALHDIRKRMEADTGRHSDRRDAALWGKADLMITDGILRFFRDVKYGRLPNDSITLRKDSVVGADFLRQQYNIMLKSGSVFRTIRVLEPKHEGYFAIKAALPEFVRRKDSMTYTFVPAWKTDSINFKSALQKRLYEEGYLKTDSIKADSSTLAAAIKKFQKDKGLNIDGRVGEATLRTLNTTDRDRFIRIALTMDKYKMLPEKMPDRYLWVNLPSYLMRLKEKDSVIIESKIICGKPITRTPQLTSAISEIITYPQWTVPASIIEKEILPAIKKDPGYLALKGFSLVDKNGDEVDPYTVDWTKYKKGIPYKVVQGSGDANALGILKFNFPNKYAVYLHDTNQRYLFKQTTRSLSHGCVRVQDWEDLARFIIRDGDTAVVTNPLPIEDSMNAWLERKEKHSIPVKKRLPLYIRYHTVEAIGKKLQFYDDIYGEDKRLVDSIFKRNKVLP